MITTATMDPAPAPPLHDDYITATGQRLALVSSSGQLIPLLLHTTVAGQGHTPLELTVLPDVSHDPHHEPRTTRVVKSIHLLPQKSITTIITMPLLPTSLLTNPAPVERLPRLTCENHPDHRGSRK